MFSGSRLIVARQRAGHTQKILAEMVGVDPRAVSGWESGDYPPSTEHEAMLARLLRYPPAFFHVGEIELPASESVSFRSMKRMRAAQRDATISACSIAFLLSEWVEQRFRLPTASIPDLREDDPVVAAAALREAWGLGERPVKNMIHLLEAKGVRVFSLSQDCVEVDACSVWRGQQPYVFLNTFKSAERSRYDAAHELGHLVLHKHAAPVGLKAEQQANAFAGAFLMPEASVRASTPAIPSLPHLVRLKQKWTVSVAALARRLHDLNMISVWHYRMLCVELQKRGYRTNEPNGAPRERSQVWEKVLAGLRSEGLSKSDIGNALCLPEREITDLVFGLAMTSISPDQPALTRTPSRHGHLRVV
jgi:Zn-dependent peptidase ImmA (M78 family)/DNA-binding XRE family transcriptional regulator